MKVLGINGSPRREGFTNLLLEKMLAGARAAGARTEKIFLDGLNLKPCRACAACEDTPACAIDDGMKGLAAKLKSADTVIVASPVYFGSITAQTKTMIDRCQSIWAGRSRSPEKSHKGRPRKGVFICAAGSNNRKYFENSRAIIKIFFSVLGIRYLDGLFVGGLDKMPAASRKRKEALLKSYRLGRFLPTAAVSHRGGGIQVKIQKSWLESA